MYDVVIPARNEARTIKPIVETLRYHPGIERIIVCVDWETTDDTAFQARSPASIVLHDSTMRGKGQCVNAGLDYVQTNRVIFCDADYRGLTLSHVDRVTFGNPNAFYTGTMIIGIPDLPHLKDIPEQFRGRLEWAWPWMSGFRVVNTDIARSVRLTGYLMEVQLNNANHKAGKGVKFTRLPGLVSPLRLDEKRLAEMERDQNIGKQEGLLP